VNINKV